MSNLREALQALERKGDDGAGLLLAEDVVAAAEAEDSPLHNYFCWDDTEAARRYRLDQARDLIATVRWVSSDRTALSRVQVYAHLRDDKRGYRRVDEMATSAPLREALLKQFKEDVASLRDKYQRHREVMNHPEWFRVLETLVETTAA